MIEKNVKKRHPTLLEATSMSFTEWVGSVSSLVVHTIFFMLCFLLGIFGVPWNSVLLVLTTLVSLEAIYLAIFIQMTVNRNSQSLEEVEEDIDEIQEDIDDIQEDVDEIQENIDDIQEDVIVMTEEEKRLESERQANLTLEKIQRDLQTLMEDISKLKK